MWIVLEPRLRLRRITIVEKGSQPSFVVVSGDIINGSNEQDAVKAREEMRAQYQVASQFLVGLCGVFFDGCRDRVIIVPGNHGMSRYASI